MDTGLVIDMIVIALLCATIFYALRLERRLANMRSTQEAFADVIRELNSSASRAEAGVQALKAAATSSGQALDDKIKRARSLGDELALLLQAGERLGNRFDATRPQPRTGGGALKALGGLR
jgi:type II secretory pathway component PulM